MAETSTFDLYDERWRDCWVAATSAVRLRKRQVDLNIEQRVGRLLDDFGPESDRPLTLRIYGTMIKGFCVINNERARALFIDCERVVLAFARQPFLEGGEGRLRMPASKRPRMEAALTLDLDLARVEASETFDWTQAPLEEGALLRLGGWGEAFDTPAAGNVDFAAPEDVPMIKGDVGWLPTEGFENGFMQPPAEVERSVNMADGVNLPPPEYPQPPCEQMQSEIVVYDQQAAGVHDITSNMEFPPNAGETLSKNETEELQGGRVPVDLQALLATRAAEKKNNRREISSRPGVVYGFDDEPTMTAADYDTWQKDTHAFTLPSRRASHYARQLPGFNNTADHLAPRLRLLLEPVTGCFSKSGLPPPRMPEGNEMMFQEAPKAEEGTAFGQQFGQQFGQEQTICEVPEFRQEPPKDEMYNGFDNPMHFNGQGGGMFDVDMGNGAGAEAQDDKTGEVGDIIRGCLRASGLDAASFHDLVPPDSADRATAACTFSALLALASAGELFVSQDHPFGRITVSEQVIAAR